MPLEIGNVCCGNYQLIKQKNIIGYCHHRQHLGIVTPTVHKNHKCCEKNCHFFEKYEDSPYWSSYKAQINKHEKAKKIKKQKKYKKAQEKTLLNDLFNKALNVLNSNDVLDVHITSVIIKEDSYCFRYVTKTGRKCKNEEWKQYIKNELGILDKPISFKHIINLEGQPASFSDLKNAA